MPVLSLTLASGLAAAAQNPGAAPEQTITIDANAPAHDFPHFWEQMFGSGRAVLSLRADYRKDLNLVKGITGFQYIRFHGIFDREVGIYSQDAQGNPVYNFSYVDQ
ncbi:MAG: GH39 family glycosyl hydrolase, partial [Bryobacteraceae bacterium]